MTYASVDQLKAVIPPSDLVLLTDFEGADAPSDIRLEQALADATAVINTFIAKVLPLPLTEVPHILTVICRRLAMRELYVNLGHEETYKDLHDLSMSMLEEIRDGKTAIGDDGDGESPLTSPGVAMTDGPDRQFTRDSLKGF